LAIKLRALNWCYQPNKFCLADHLTNLTENEPSRCCSKRTRMPIHPGRDPASPAQVLIYFYKAGVKADKVALYHLDSTL